MEQNEESPQLKGFVIITLPPPDNPSIGKTITAFTLTDNSQSTIQEQQHSEEPPQIRDGPQDQWQFSPQRSVFGSPIIVFGLINLSLIALFSLVFMSQQTLFELRDTDDDRKSNTVIFPLFAKVGIQGNLQKDVELKLGRFVDYSAKIIVEIPNDGRSQRMDTNTLYAESKMDSTTIFPVKGNIYPDGLYYTYMLVGNPPRPYFLDIDTGSDLTWIQCDAPCTSCAKGAHPFYRPKKSNLVNSEDSYCSEVQNLQGTKCETCNQCDYEIQYADHSSSMGVLSKDKFRLIISNGSVVNPDIVFGCAYDQQGVLLNSLSKTDGILGLGRGKISLPSQLATRGNIQNVVGHCLAADAGGGGFVFLGSDFVPQQQIGWVPMVAGPFINSYRTQVTKVSYGAKQLSFGGRGNGAGHVVFDSGSSYTYFPERVYNDLVANLEDITSEDLIQDASDDTLPVCWRAKSPVRSVTEVRQFFRPLELKFGTNWWIVPTKLQIPPEGYLTISSKGNICLGILDGSKVHDGSTIILGDISLRGRLFVFDNVNQKIGWIESECRRPKLLDSLVVS